MNRLKTRVLRQDWRKCMLKEITFDEVEKIWEDGEIGRVLYLYPDGTDAYIGNNDHWTDIIKHRDNGGKFAIEI